MMRKADKICTKNRNLNMENFQIKLTNRFKQLHNDPEYNEINNWIKSLINITNQTAIDVAGKQTKDSENDNCNEIKQLMDKRRKMKSDMSARTRIEHTELCKTIRKKIRENTRQRNMKMIYRRYHHQQQKSEENCTKTPSWKIKFHQYK